MSEAARKSRASSALQLMGLAIALVAGLPTQAAVQVQALQPFLLPDAPVELRLTGSEPGAAYVVLASSTPAAITAGSLGTLYLAPGTFEVLGRGVSDGAGVSEISLPPPTGLEEGDRLYVQALSLASPRSLSNSVALRASAGLPSGQRASRALAVTPDGRRAYVVHQVDGTVTVVDSQADAVVAELPITTGARSVPHRPVDVAISPDGAYAFVTSATADFMAVVDVDTDSVVAEVPVPRGSRRVAFDFSGVDELVYVTNDVANAVLVLRRDGPGTFHDLRTCAPRGSFPTHCWCLVIGDCWSATGCWAN
ncbi:MAG: beta-propeller fold lactonase family protein [Pseudomonadota bacterium]